MSGIGILCKSNPGLIQDIAYTNEILYCNHFIIFICNGIAGNDEVVAVEDFIDVGNILGKSWAALYCLNNSQLYVYKYT